MNSDPNIDSKQCPESKLGQVHSVHTPMAQAARTLRAGLAVSWLTRRRVMAFPQSYCSLCQAVSLRARGHWRAVSQPCVVTQGCVTALCRDRRPCRKPLSVMIQNLYRDPSPYSALTARRVVHAAARVAAPIAVLWHIVAPYSSPGTLYRDPKSPPSATIQFFFFFVSRPRGRPAHDTNFVSQHPHLARLRIVSQASSIVSRTRPAVSWLCPAVSCPPPGAPRHACLLSLLCACSARCVPA